MWDDYTKWPLKSTLGIETVSLVPSFDTKKTKLSFEFDSAPQFRLWASIMYKLNGQAKVCFISFVFNFHSASFHLPVHAFNQYLLDSEISSTQSCTWPELFQVFCRNFRFLCWLNRRSSAVSAQRSPFSVNAWLKLATIEPDFTRRADLCLIWATAWIKPRLPSADIKSVYYEPGTK